MNQSWSLSWLWKHKWYKRKHDDELQLNVIMVQKFTKKEENTAIRCWDRHHRGVQIYSSRSTTMNSAQLVVLNLCFALLENKTMTMTNFGSLSSWYQKLTWKEENTMMRSWTPHRHGVQICNLKTTMTSWTCHCHGLGFYNARKQNHDDDELQLVIIMVLKAHVKRIKHNDKEELEYAILETRRGTELVIVMDLGFAAL